MWNFLKNRSNEIRSNEIRIRQNPLYSSELLNHHTSYLDCQVCLKFGVVAPLFINFGVVHHFIGKKRVNNIKADHFIGKIKGRPILRQTWPSGWYSVKIRKLINNRCMNIPNANSEWLWHHCVARHSGKLDNGQPSTFLLNQGSLDYTFLLKYFLSN